MDFDTWLDTADFSSAELIIMIGLGPRGSRAARVREKTNAKLLVFEPREQIRNLYVGVDDCLVSATVPRMRGRLRAAVENLAGDSFLVNDDDEAKRIGDAVGEDVVSDVLDLYKEAEQAAWYKFFSAIYSADSRVKQTMESLDLLFQFPPINLLEGKFAGRAGIVVGAGPSLDKNIHVLREHRDKFIVAAVNTSLPALELAGISPDLVIICEAKPVGQTLLNSQSVKDAIMIPGLHASRDSWDLPWKKIAPAISNEGLFGVWIRDTLGIPAVPIGGSSCCLAAGALWLLGCDPIVLIGNDCAPSEAGQLYCDGASFAGTTVKIGEDGGAVITKSDAKLAVEDVGRKERNTSCPSIETWSWDKSHRIQSVLIYDGLRQWFEEIAETWPGKRLVNATEGGAHIRNWESTPLVDIASELSACEGSFVDDMCSLLDDQPAPLKDLVIDALKEQIEGAERMADVAKSGIEIMAEAESIRQEMAADSVDPMIGWTWDIAEQRKRDGSQALFLALSESFDEMEDERAARLADLMRSAREMQLDPIMTSPTAVLLDAYTWGFIEQARRRGDRGVFGIFKGMLSELERGSTELVPILEATMEKINER